MTHTLHTTQKSTAPVTITVVGGGFTGSTIAVQQARHYISLYEKDPSLPPLTIRIVDEKGSFGPGVPYKTPDDVFLVSQPASAMSPFPEDHDHFTRWLRDRDAQAGADTFASRHQYGEYLKQTLRETFNAAVKRGVPLKLETLSGKVTDITPDKKGVTLTHENGENTPTQAVILATGHSRSPFLRELEGKNDRYFAAVHDVAPVQKVLKNATTGDSVAIIGTGQSMIDILGVLDHIGYKGKIYALSRSLTLPWAFDPALHRRQPKPYVPLYLDPVRISKVKDLSADALLRRLEREFRRAQRLGYGIGNVLTALDFGKLAVAGPAGTAPEGLAKLREHVDLLWGNPIPLERHELLNRYLASGQLELVERNISAEDFVAEKDGFTGKDLGGKKRLRLSAVFNAAAYTRSALANPLINKVAEKKLLRQQGAVLKAGQQNHPAIFAAGPPTNAARWGVETFRDNNALVAKQSVEAALGIRRGPQV